MTRRRGPWHTNWRSYVPWIKSTKGSYRATTLARSVGRAEQARCCGGRSGRASLMRSMVTKRIRPPWSKMRRSRGLDSSRRKGRHMVHFSIFTREEKMRRRIACGSTIAVGFSMFDAITKRGDECPVDGIKYGFFRRAESRSGTFNACCWVLSTRFEVRRMNLTCGTRTGGEGSPKPRVQVRQNNPAPQGFRAGDEPHHPWISHGINSAVKRLLDCLPSPGDLSYDHQSPDNLFLPSTPWRSGCFKPAHQAGATNDIAITTSPQRSGTPKAGS